jgi:hypothetical protein
MMIDRPDDYADIANLDLTLAERNLNEDYATAKRRGHRPFHQAE